MSVGLHIEFDDGTEGYPSEIGMASARCWSEKAWQLGLPLLPELDGGYLPIGPPVFEQLIAEFERFASAFAADEPVEKESDVRYWSQAAASFTDDLLKLRGRSDWKGDFG